MNSAEARYDALLGLGTIAAAIVAGVVIHRILCWALTRWAARSSSPVPKAIVNRLTRPAAYIVPLILVLIALPNVVLSKHAQHAQAIVEHAAGIATIAAIAWASAALVTLWGDVVLVRYRTDVTDNLLARQMGTRVAILSRTMIILIGLLGIAIALMTFPTIRAVGTTLLASAGAAGLIIGLAARPLFENLIAGVQLAFTEPIRLDDVVVVQGYWGNIEEIHSTYVVIKVWDWTRVIVPLSWFITNTFENWTRRTAELIGQVYVFADYSLDVEALRAQLPIILEGTKLWDGHVQNCQVVDATDRAIQIRVLVTARNSGDLWDLRCFVREEIVKYIREKQPHAMPSLRVLSRDGEERHDVAPSAPRQGADEVQRVRTVTNER